MWACNVYSTAASGHIISQNSEHSHSAPHQQPPAPCTCPGPLSVVTTKQDKYSTLSKQIYIKLCPSTNLHTAFKFGNLINWQDHISNNEIRRQVQRQWMVMDTIRQTKLPLFGHICRMSDDRLLMSLVFGMVEGERRPGRPVRRWIDDILMWCGQDVQEAMMITVDRDNWRRFVASPYDPC